MKLLKKSILLSLVAPLLFSLLSFTNAVGGSDVVTIRIYENIQSDPRITISSKGQQKRIELEKIKTSAAEDRNTVIISNTLDQYYKDGYKIETSNSVSNMASEQVTTYILTK